MADAGSSSALRRVAHAIADTWRALDVEQRVAAVGALLLIVSTFGPFSFVEGAIVLTGASVLLLLRRRAQGRDFQLPLGDGTMIAAAGAWSAVLILLRLFSRPLGQGLLALVCAAILVLAGIRERAVTSRRERRSAAPAAPPRSPRARRRRSRAAARELFGVDPPEWTTPESGDPTVARPPAWQREEEERGPASASQPSLFDPADAEAPAEQLREEPRRSVPPATRVARQPPKPDR